MSAANEKDNSIRLFKSSIHKHGLVLKELSDNFSRFHCSVCRSSVKGGPAYYCPYGDRFFLHKYCSQFPYEIQHPFHPQHPLFLRYESDVYIKCSGCSASMEEERYRYSAHMLEEKYYYQCDECRPKVVLHIGCATVTLSSLMNSALEQVNMPEEETIQLQHIAHKHPLESFCVNNSPWKPYCSACKEKISGRAYGCRACIFLLHESCALAAPQIESHALHPQHALTLVNDFEGELNCGACKTDSTPFVYRCHGCNFNLHLRCAVSVERHHMSIPQDDHDTETDGLEIHHFSHPHPLTYCNTKEAIGLICNCCAEEITDDFYVCPDCSFMLHKSCAELSREMKHPSHPKHLLMLQTDPYDCFLCVHKFNYRRGVIYCNWFTEFFFKCQECEFGLHLSCALQSLSLSKEELTMNIPHIHKHPMRPCNYTGDCKICGEECQGMAYGCVKEGITCSLMIHKTCAELQQQSVFSVHPEHPLLLSQPTERSTPIGCGACQDSYTMIDEFVLLCDPCEVKFHVRCALKKPTLKHQRHEHALTYFEFIAINKKSNVLCKVCGDDCRFDIYRCVPCNYNIHYSCSSLPPSVKHEWHVHPMVLRDNFINEDFDYDEQYCDLCETVRHPEHGVYYCIECRCATHIDCIIPKLVQDVDKRRRMDELEHRKLKEQILSLEGKAETTRKELEASREKLERLTKVIAALKGREQEILSSMMQPEE